MVFILRGSMSLTPKQQERLQKAIVTNRLLFQQRINEYNLSPTHCLFCNKILDYEKRKNKFCCQSCAASFNNKDKVRNFTTGLYGKKACLNCGSINEAKKYCNYQCRKEYKVKEIKITGIV